VVGDLQLEETAVAVVAFSVVAGAGVVGEQVPVGKVAARAADFVEQLFAGDGVLGDTATGGCGVVEQIPLGHVEVALADLLAVAVAVGIVEADAGQAALVGSADAATVPTGGGDELLGAGIGDQGKGVFARVGVSRRIVRLQAGVDV